MTAAGHRKVVLVGSGPGGAMVARLVSSRERVLGAHHRELGRISDLMPHSGLDALAAFGRSTPGSGWCC